MVSSFNLDFFRPQTLQIVTLSPPKSFDNAKMAGKKQPRKKSSKSGGPRQKRVALEIESDNEEGATDSTSKKNDFVTALLKHKARAGINALQLNGVLMPHKWYQRAICELQVLPGCSKIQFKKCDIKNMVRKILNAKKK